MVSLWPGGPACGSGDVLHPRQERQSGEADDHRQESGPTRNGRTVYDGGGIDPDIVIEQEEYAKIVGSLVSKQLIFDFATEFVLQNDSIEAPGVFKISDVLYEDFVMFLSDKEYEYETNTEKKMTELIDKVEDEYADFKKDLEVLHKKLLSYKEDDIHKYQSQVSELILSELMARYYYQEGRVIASLADDPVLKEAISVLRDSDRYEAILSGTIDDQ